MSFILNSCVNDINSNSHLEAQTVKEKDGHSGDTRREHRAQSHTSHFGMSSALGPGVPTQNGQCRLCHLNVWDSGCEGPSSRRGATRYTGIRSLWFGFSPLVTHTRDSLSVIVCFPSVPWTKQAQKHLSFSFVIYLRQPQKRMCFRGSFWVGSPRTQAINVSFSWREWEGFGTNSFGTTEDEIK